MKEIARDLQGQLDQINTVGDPAEQDKIRSKLFQASFSNSILACQSKLDSIVLLGKETKVKTSKACIFQPRTLQFAQDPCCNRRYGNTTRRKGKHSSWLIYYV
jgi:hypothetical protein